MPLNSSLVATRSSAKPSGHDIGENEKNVRRSRRKAASLLFAHGRDRIAMIVEGVSQALLVDLGLRIRHGGELLRDGHAETGDGAGERGNDDDVAEIIHVASSLVAGKGHRMAIVVRGVMHRLDVGEAHAADDEHAEQSGGEIGTTRARSARRPRWHGSRVWSVKLI
jgi:hypothetical protein